MFSKLAQKERSYAYLYFYMYMSSYIRCWNLFYTNQIIPFCVGTVFGSVWFI